MRPQHPDPTIYLMPKFPYLLQQRQVVLEVRDCLDDELSAYFNAYFYNQFSEDYYAKLSPLVKMGLSVDEMAPQIYNQHSVLKYIAARRTTQKATDYACPGSCLCFILRCRVTQVVLGLAILNPDRDIALSSYLKNFLLNQQAEFQGFYYLEYLCSISGAVNRHFHQAESATSAKNYWGNGIGTLLMMIVYFYTTKFGRGFFLNALGESEKFYQALLLDEIEVAGAPVKLFRSPVGLDYRRNLGHKVNEMLSAYRTVPVFTVNPDSVELNPAQTYLTSKSSTISKHISSIVAMQRLLRVRQDVLKK